MDPLSPIGAPSSTPFSFTTIVLVPLGFTTGGTSFEKALCKALEHHCVPATEGGGTTGTTDADDGAKLVASKSFRTRHSYVSWQTLQFHDRAADLCVLDPLIKRDELIYEYLFQADIVVFLSPTTLNCGIIAERFLPALQVRRPTIIGIENDAETPFDTRIKSAFGADIVAKSGFTIVDPVRGKMEGPFKQLVRHMDIAHGEPTYLEATAPHLLREIYNRVPPAKAFQGDPRAGLPLRMVLNSRMSRLRVNQFHVLQGTVKVGMKIMANCDPLETARDDGGNVIVSMRTFPANIPVSVAYPGMHVGILCQGDVDANNHDANSMQGFKAAEKKYKEDTAAKIKTGPKPQKPTPIPNFWDAMSKDAVFGEAERSVFPKVPLILQVQHCEKVISAKELHILGPGGMAIAKVLHCSGTMQLLQVHDVGNTLCIDVKSTAKHQATSGVDEELVKMDPLALHNARRPADEKTAADNVNTASIFHTTHTPVVLQWTEYTYDKSSYTHTPATKVCLGWVNVGASLQRLGLHTKLAIAVNEARDELRVGEGREKVAQEALQKLITAFHTHLKVTDDANTGPKGICGSFKFLTAPVYSTAKNVLKKHHYRSMQVHELLCDCTPVQHSLGLNVFNSSKTFPLFSLLLMFSKVTEDPTLFQEALSIIPVAASGASGPLPPELDDYNGGVKYLPNTPTIKTGNGSYRQAETVTVQAIAATCNGDKAVKVIEQWMSSTYKNHKSTNDIRQRLIDAFIIIGQANPVMRLLGEGTSVSRELVQRVVYSPHMPPYVILNMCLLESVPTDMRMDYFTNTTNLNAVSKCTFQYTDQRAVFRCLGALQRYHHVAQFALCKRFKPSSMTLSFMAHCYILMRLVETLPRWDEMPSTALSNIMRFLPGGSM